MPEEIEPSIELDHPKFSRAEIAVFTKRVVTDCMSYGCTIVATKKQKNDACCQYGCDVDLLERDAILAKADIIRPVLSPEVQNLPWFDESKPERDPDTPSGTVVRTAVHNEGCLFLTRPSVFPHNADAARFRANAKDLFDAIAAGHVKVDIGARFPLADVAHAHEAAERRETTGAILLLP